MPKTLSPKEVIGIFVTIIIGAALVTPLGSVVWTGLHNVTNTSVPAAGPSNITGAPAALYGLLTLFFVIVVIIVAVKHIKK